MNKKKIKLILMTALIIFFFFTITNSTLAIDPNDPNWDPNPQIDQTITGKAGVILGWIQYIGILVGLITLTIIGLKYIFSSVEGKAEYKKTVMQYVIGCLLLMGVSVLIGFVGSIVSNENEEKERIIKKNEGSEKCPECGEELGFEDTETGEYWCLNCGHIWKKTK